MRALVFVAVISACSSSKNEPTPGVELDSTAAEDAEETRDVATDGKPDAAAYPVKRLPCVQRSGLATDLPATTYGALEGDLVTIIPPGTKGCPADTDHVHLQIAVGEKRYDVAMTVDSMFNAPLAIHLHVLAPTLIDPGFATAKFDYERDIGTPSADFTALAKDALAAKIIASLSDAGRIRVFGETYDDGTGIHLVHRNGTDRDGVLIVHRVEAAGADRAVALRFANNVF